MAGDVAEEKVIRGLMDDWYVGPELQVGFHIWHILSPGPFFRAEQTFDELKEYANF